MYKETLLLPIECTVKQLEGGQWYRMFTQKGYYPVTTVLGEPWGLFCGAH